MSFQTSRRRLLAGGTALFASTFVPLAWAAPGGRDPRLLVIVLRGGLDGLGAVLPVGDPAYAALRSDFKPEALAAAPRLDNTFALNPAMKNLAALYAQKEAVIFHAIATPYRDRSHFDAQEVLESGQPRPAMGADSGWLNRALARMPRAPGVKVTPQRGLAVAATTPLILRGPAPVESWQPQAMNYAEADTLERLSALYSARDLKLAAALKEGARVDAFLNDAPSMQKLGKQAPASVDGFPAAANAAARLMAPADGPRVAAMNFDGWDTHVQQGPYEGRLAKSLTALDLGIAGLRDGLGASWRDTAVLIVTEFGRTVKVNGTRGTDHGNGTVAFLVGGAVKGGRVVADWPGLRQDQLLDGRDLNPTTDMRAVMKGVLAEQLGIDASVLAAVFPGSDTVRPMAGLIRV